MQTEEVCLGWAVWRLSSLYLSHTVTQSLNLILNDLLDDIANTVSFFVPHPSKCFGGLA